MSTPRYSPREALYRIGTAIGFGVAFALVVMFIYPRYGWAFTILIMLVLLLMLVRAFSRTYAYRCANCGHTFKAPTLVNLLTFSGVGRNADGTYHSWKSLTCPHCGQRTRAVALKAGPGSAPADPYSSRGNVGGQAGRGSSQTGRGGSKSGGGQAAPGGRTKRGGTSAARRSQQRRGGQNRSG